MAEGVIGAPLALIAPDQDGTYRVVVCEFDQIKTHYADDLGDDILAHRVLFVDAVRL